MVHLRLFGGVVLLRDGEPVVGRPAQRHHAALLALLATAPGQSASRDKLIAYLWPESDTTRARHRLSVALHVLRRSLGSDCVLTAGDAVTLNPAVVQTDVGDFHAALAAGRLEEAVRVYAGPFLDGFHVRGALDFERWIDAERDKLVRLFRGALERLVSEAEERDDRVTALRWWRRLAALDPLGSPVALGLAKALAATGDVPRALLHLRAYVALIRGELGIAPDPEVLELASRLQESADSTITGASGDGREVGATPEPEPVGPSGDGFDRTPPAALDRRWRSAVLAVAVAGLVFAGAWGLGGSGDAAEQAPTTDALVLPFRELAGQGRIDPRGRPGELGESLAEHVAATLALVPGLDVQAAPASAALMEWRGNSSGAPALVQGMIRREADRIIVTVGLEDGSSAHQDWSASWASPSADPAVLLEELSLVIADTLRLRLAPYEPKTYTESTRAYDRFLEGVWAHRRYNEADVWKALQFYREAYEEDPSFALAHAIAGNAYIALVLLGLSSDVGYDRARDHVTEALAIDSTLAEGHAALGYIQVWGDRDFAAGEQSLRRAIMLYPMLPQARDWYGWYALYVRDRPDLGVASVRKALELDPLNAARSYSVEWALYRARRYEQVAEQNRVTWTVGPEVARTVPTSPLAHAYRELGRFEESIAEFRALQERIGGPPPAGLAITYARMGREAEARALLHELVEGREASLVESAQIHANLGDMDEAYRLLGLALERNPSALVALRADPALDPIRADSRYPDLLRRIGLSAPVAGNAATDDGVGVSTPQG